MNGEGRLAADLAAGGVGPAARRKALALLGGEWGRLPANPMRAVKLPQDRRSRTVRPLTPVMVEALRARMAQGDAALVSLLAYVGPRPQEALALRWRDLGERTIRFYAPKTNRDRTARLMAPVRQDLAEWRLASGRPDDEQLVFPRHDGGTRTPGDWRNRRARTFAPAVEAAEIPFHVVPYDLRHSAASLWLQEDASVVEVARWLGNKPSVTADTYAHVLDDLDAAEREAAEAQIRRARGGLVPAEFLHARPGARP